MYISRLHFTLMYNLHVRPIQYMFAQCMHGYIAMIDPNIVNLNIK